MKAKSTPRARLLAAILGLGLASAFTLPATLSAQEVKTIPVGAINLTIAAASSPTTPRYTSLSLPLTDGIVYRGVLSAVTSNTITVSPTITDSFGLTTPFLIRLTSGAHKGRSFVINSNSGSVLTLNNQGTPLDSLVPALNVGASGDNFVIFVGDTLNGVFGSNVQGGTSAATADQVWLWQASGQYNKYYYNTSNNRWQDTVFGSPSNSVIIRPDTGVMFMRRATTDLALQLTGEVPTSEARIVVRDYGYTEVATTLPVNNTLLGLGIHLQANWAKGANASVSDQIWIWQSGSGTYNKYYYNTTNSRWQDTVFGSPSNNTTIAAGTPVMIKKVSASGSTSSVVVSDLPSAYNIN